jgi:hypothetical protein
MEDSAETRIWRFMNLAKFVSLLATESLYFTNPQEFDDPYEGVVPKANAQQLAEDLQDVCNSSLPHATTEEEKMFLNALNDFVANLPTYRSKPTLRSGVNCWHKSEYESEAMWKLYSVSGPGIAIESTIGQLKASLANTRGLIVGSVLYLNFDKEQWKSREDGPSSPLFVKRNSFAHEKELRAVIPLPKVGKGTFVKCNLDILINKIHISPFAPGYFKEVVENLCAGRVHSLNKFVVQSQMFKAPDYSIKRISKI